MKTPSPKRVARRFAYRIPTPKFGPQTPLGEWDGTKVKYKVKSNSDGILVAVYYGRKKIGWMNAYKELYPERDGKPCADDVQRLVAQNPQLEHPWTTYDGEERTKIKGLHVYKAFITDEQYHGKGIGKAMYEALMREWFKKTGPFVFIPMYCTIGSGTSPEAKRVWDSLARRFPSSGHAIAVLKAP